MAAIDENEEFEFRLRAEREAEQTQPEKPQEEPSGFAKGVRNITRLANPMLSIADAVSGRGGEAMDRIGDTVAGVASGAASIPMGALKLTRLINPFDRVANKTGTERSIEEFDKERAGNASFAIPRIATQIAGTAGVGNVLARGAQAIPAVANSARLAPYIEALKTSGMSAGTPQAPIGMLARMAAGGTVGGATSGLLNPEDAGTGAAIGAALPPALAGAGRLAQFATSSGKNIYNSLDEMLGGAGGTRRSVGRVGREIVGDANIPQVVQLARNAPASQTFGQATREAAIPQLAAAQEFAKKQLNVNQRYLNIDDLAEAKRARVLEKVKPDLQKAIDARKLASDPLYQAAENAGNVVNTRSVIDKIDDLLTRKSGNPELVTELNRIRNGLHNKVGRKFIPKTNSEEVSSVIDGIKTSLGKKENKLIIKYLDEIKNDLVDAVPNMKQAQQKFAEMSPKVNQAKVIGEMQKVIEKPGGGERRGPFLNVIGKGEDALIKKSTGAPRYTDADLDKVLSPRQNKVKDAIAAQFTGQERDKELASRGSEAFNKIIRTNESAPTLPGMIDKAVTIANAIIRRASGKGGAAVDKELSRLMLPENKKEFAALLEAAAPKQRYLITKYAEKMKKGAMIGIGKTAPVLATDNER